PRSCPKASAASGRPAMIPDSRALSVAVATASGGSEAWLVRSPARPKSSASATRTASVTRCGGNSPPVNGPAIALSQGTAGPVYAAAATGAMGPGLVLAHLAAQQGAPQQALPLLGLYTGYQREHGPVEHPESDQRDRRRADAHGADGRQQRIEGTAEQALRDDLLASGDGCLDVRRGMAS